MGKMYLIIRETYCEPYYGEPSELAIEGACADLDAALTAAAALANAGKVKQVHSPCFMGPDVTCVAVATDRTEEDGGCSLVDEFHVCEIPAPWVRCEECRHHGFANDGDLYCKKTSHKKSPGGFCDLGEL